MDPALFLLSFIVFLPAVAAILLIFIPGEQKEMLRYFTLAVTIVVLAAAVIGFMFAEPESTGFSAAQASMQNVFNVSWIPSFDIYYYMGVDGISFLLVMLTAFVSVLAMAASWPIEKHVKAYCILFLLLETGMLGVFMALDFFLFYVFWEVMLLPMYFLIGVWGGPRREYAAIKFFLYTLLGSVLMLIAILLLYFNSDLVQLRHVAQESGAVDWDRLHIHPEVTAKVAEAHAQWEELGFPDDNPYKVHTFNLLALAALGQHTDVFSYSVQMWSFILLFIGFVIKVPSVPVHTWLPDAHVEAPTPISMILAGVLLKMGGYGIIRICYPICPIGGYELSLFVCIIGVVSMVYGAFGAMAQKDFKRLVAYSSVSHMGYVVLGLGVWSMTATGAGGYFNPMYWNMGVKGAMFQMIGHGVSSAGMFFMVGVIYDRVHHRNLDQFGGLFGRMPVYSALSIGLFFAALGLPGLCGFPGEILVVLSAWTYSRTLAIIAAAVVVLTAGYILWCLQRVYLGPEYKGPHSEAITPMKVREIAIASVLLFFAILFGVFPHSIGNQPTVLGYMDATIDQQTDELATWTRRYYLEETPTAVATSPAETPKAVADEGD